MQYEDSAKRLRKAMEDVGITAQELSNASGIPKSSISHYVNGRHKITFGSAVRMSPYLDVTPDYLIGISVSNVAGSEGYMISVSNKFTLPTEILKLNKTNFDRMIEYGKKLLELQDLEDIE